MITEALLTGGLLYVGYKYWKLKKAVDGVTLEAASIRRDLGIDVLNLINDVDALSGLRKNVSDAISHMKVLSTQGEAIKRQQSDLSKAVAYLTDVMNERSMTIDAIEKKVNPANKYVRKPVTRKPVKAKKK